MDAATTRPQRAGSVPRSVSAISSASLVRSRSLSRAVKEAAAPAAAEAFQYEKKLLYDLPEELIEDIFNKGFDELHFASNDWLPFHCARAPWLPPLMLTGNSKLDRIAGNIFLKRMKVVVQIDVSSRTQVEAALKFPGGSMRLIDRGLIKAVRIHEKLAARTAPSLTRNIKSPSRATRGLAHDPLSKVYQAFRASPLQRTTDTSWISRNFFGPSSLLEPPGERRRSGSQTGTKL